MLERLMPGLGWMKDYRKEWIRGDLFAGLTVGVMLVPQGMAYAMIAGLPPIYGLYAATVPLLIYALFGTSRQLAVGPVALVALLISTGVGALSEIGSEEYIGMTILLSLLVGLIQLAMSAFRLGFLANFLSHPVISGFTSGAALIIGFSQFKHLLGISMPSTSKLHELLWYLANHVQQTHWISLALGLAGIAVIIGSKRIDRRIPGPLLAVVLGIAAVHFLHLDEQGVKVIGIVPSGLPKASLPTGTWTHVQQLIPIAITIALISFVESYAIAQSVQRRHRNYEVSANKELLALGLAKLGGAFFQAHPTTGGFSRTAVNDQAGAQTGLSGIISAVLVGLTLLFLTPLFRELPQAVLASVILVAIYGLLDVAEVRYLFSNGRRDLLMLLATFFATVTLGVKAGILTGLTLSLADVIYRSSRPHYAVLGEYGGKGIYRNILRFPEAVEPKGTLIIRPDAPWIFPNVAYWQDVIRQRLAERPDTRVIIIDGASISAIDSSGLHFMMDLLQEYKDQHIEIRFSGLIGPVRDKLYKSGIFAILGKENVFMTLPEAVADHHSSQQALSDAIRPTKLTR